ncbi:MAG: hypothetical protein K2I69_00230 [Muribaculaceae bacterium]|nr:hypothetical protein [Muribaculaceae bacterium]
MSNINTSSPANQAINTAPAKNKNKRASNLCVWLACLLCIISWCTLIWSNGYAALALAVCSVALGFIGAHGNSTGYKRFATTSIIASTVLLVIVAAYLMVLKFGLGV